jgi:hypothetical protein
MVASTAVNTVMITAATSIAMIVMSDVVIVIASENANAIEVNAVVVEVIVIVMSETEGKLLLLLLLLPLLLLPLLLPLLHRSLWFNSTHRQPQTLLHRSMPLVHLSVRNHLLLLISFRLLLLLLLPLPRLYPSKPPRMTSCRCSMRLQHNRQCLPALNSAHKSTCMYNRFHNNNTTLHLVW